MFSRIKEAARIIAYSEPQTGADAVVMECQELPASQSGRIISHVIEGLAAALVLGYVAGHLGSLIYKGLPHHGSLSTTTVVGAVGAFLMLILHWVKNDIEVKIRSHIHFADALAPYFGHRLENAARILRGPGRASS